MGRHPVSLAAGAYDEMYRDVPFKKKDAEGDKVEGAVQADSSLKAHLQFHKL